MAGLFTRVYKTMADSHSESLLFCEGKREKNAVVILILLILIFAVFCFLPDNILLQKAGSDGAYRGDNYILPHRAGHPSGGLIAVFGRDGKEGNFSTPGPYASGDDYCVGEYESSDNYGSRDYGSDPPDRVEFIDNNPMQLQMLAPIRWLVPAQSGEEGEDYYGPEGATVYTNNLHTLSTPDHDELVN